MSIVRQMTCAATRREAKAAKARLDKALRDWGRASRIRYLGAYRYPSSNTVTEIPQIALLHPEGVKYEVQHAMQFKADSDPDNARMQIENEARMLQIALREPRLWWAVSSDDLFPLTQSDNARLREVAMFAVGIIPDVPQVSPFNTGSRRVAS